MAPAKTGPLEPGGKHDWLLDLYARLAEKAGLEIGITLTIHGLVATGTLVSGLRYYEGMAEQIESAGGPGTLGAAIRTLGRNLYRPEEGGTDESLVPPGVSLGDTPVYLHLENAHVIAGGAQIPTGSGTWWRCQLRAVDSFA